MNDSGDDPTARSAAEELARRLIGNSAFGKGPKQGPKPKPRSEGTGRFRWSGPGPDVRDPKAFSELCDQLRQGETWAAKLTEGKLVANWSSIVGEQIAQHTAPTQLVDGVLHVQAESTAWATQLRLIQTQLLEKIAAATARGTVRMLKITGPKAPSWRKGERHVRGRGPRDTYG